ncbi:MAG: amidohydrolase family protein [Phycisphaerae bacterium]|nr:amidohydrolase family protein [Phycisphaerae bacterium]
MYPNLYPNQPGKTAGHAARAFVAAEIRDGAGVRAAPGAVAFGDGRVLAAGSEAEVRAAVPPETLWQRRPDCLLLPGLVNAHAHLDLTSVSPVAYGGSFVSWLKMVTEARPKDETTIDRAVREGARRSYAAGVLTIGDIAGSPTATDALRQTGLRGVSFREFFGIGGASRDRALGEMEQWAASIQGDGIVRDGLQPHAPYSCGRDLYRRAAELALAADLPLCTHLAETREELQFIAEGKGPFAELLDELGKSGDVSEVDYGRGARPVPWLFGEDLSEKPPWLCAHANYVDDDEIERLGAAGASVVYCPRASQYFGHHGHRYRDMLAAGVKVCLGTDSIVCHGTLSILDEMKFLFRRDGTDPERLLEMATVNGMQGLGLPAAEASFRVGSSPGLVAYTSSGGGFAGLLAGDTEPHIEVLVGTGPESTERNTA